MSKDLLSYFPESDIPRDIQVDVIKKIQASIARGTRFIICQCPTGSGKSHIAATLAASTSHPTKKFSNLIHDQRIFSMHEDGTYVYAQAALNESPYGTMVLTTTKYLQDQYNNLFNNSLCLKGKKNYRCNVDQDFDCDLAPCIVASNLKKQCQADKICSYYTARDDTLLTNFAVLNYSMFLALPNHVKRKEILVCDEASEIEDELVSQYSVEIDYDKLKWLNIKYHKLLSEDHSVVHSWIQGLIHLVGKSCLSHKTNSSKANTLKGIIKSDRLKLQYSNNLYDHLKAVNRYFNECEYIVEFSDKKVTLVPLYINKLARNIFDHADVNVLMSATIIDHKNFTKTLGIEEDEYEYIEVESTFDAEKSPIYCPGKFSLSYKNIDRNLRHVSKQVKDICDHYSDKSGIVHTHNFKITEYIKDDISKNKERFLFRDYGVTNEDILKKHFT